MGRGPMLTKKTLCPVRSSESKAKAQTPLLGLAAPPRPLEADDEGGTTSRRTTSRLDSGTQDNEPRVETSVGKIDEFSGDDSGHVRTVCVVC